MYKTITKEFSFDSSHRLIDKDLTKKENIKIFGKCYNPPSHGHNYVLHVTVSGEEKYGMIINFSKLKEIVNRYVIDIFDHHFINDLVCMKDMISTCEDMIDVIWDLLDKNLKKEGVVLEELKLYETPTSWVIKRRD